MAFRLLEQRPISSLSDTSPKAQAAADAWPRALRVCLERADWGFARVIADLPEVNSATPGYLVDVDLSHGYSLPSDLVRIRKVGDGNICWRADKDYLHADQAGPLRIIYTAEVSDPARLPQSFQVAVAYKLATLMPELQTSRSKRQALIADAADAMADALEADRIDASPGRYDDRPEPGDWASEAIL